MYNSEETSFRPPAIEIFQTETSIRGLELSNPPQEALLRLANVWANN